MMENKRGRFGQRDQSSFFIRMNVLDETFVWSNFELVEKRIRRKSRETDVSASPDRLGHFYTLSIKNQYNETKQLCRYKYISS